MIFPISGVVQFFGFIVILFFGVRAIIISREDKESSIFFLGIGCLLVALSRLFLAIPCLIFLEAQNWWFWFEIIERSFLVFGFSLIGYGVFSATWLKNHINKILFFLIIISIIIISDFFINPPHYFLDENGVLFWKDFPVFSSLLHSLFNFFISISVIIVFLRDFFYAKSRKAKARLIIIPLIFFFTILSSIFDFFIVPSFNLDPLISEINYIICYFLILISIIIGYLIEKKVK